MPERWAIGSAASGASSCRRARARCRRWPTCRCWWRTSPMSSSGGVFWRRHRRSASECGSSTRWGLKACPTPCCWSTTAAASWSGRRSPPTAFSVSARGLSRARPRRSSPTGWRRCSSANRRRRRSRCERCRPSNGSTARGAPSRRPTSRCRPIPAGWLTASRSASPCCPTPCGDSLRRESRSASTAWSPPACWRSSCCSGA